MNETTRTSNAIFNNQSADQPVAPPQSQGDPGYSVPVDVVPLPSRGVVYPEGSILHNLEGVEIRAMTAAEEDILMSRALIKKGTVITHLLRACITDKRINPDEMISGDRNALLVALRITGYGAEYPVGIECPDCGESEEATFDLSELGIKFLELEPTAPGRNEFEFHLPVSKKKIKFRFLTGADEASLSQDLEARKKKLRAQVDNIVTSRLQRQITEVDGNTDRSYIAKFVRNMPVLDSRSLRKHVEKSEPGVDMNDKFVCGSCGEVNEVEVPIGASFFWPDA